VPRVDRSNALDHVVVIMFENRSLDNLLGRLYQPGEVKSFEGVIGRELSNPIPDWAEHGADRKTVPYAVAKSMDLPNPDSGEEYPHINTQVFGLIDPSSNRSVSYKKMVAPFNVPANPNARPTMDGFVADYISTFTSEAGKQAPYEEYAQIMIGYTPKHMPVVSALARGFAVFDHWFCEVPSQTFPNRSFFHAATSSGYVVNTSPPDSFPVHNTAETIFERLEAKGLTWRVYCDPPTPITFTGLIHASRLIPERTVITDEYRHTSVIRTLRERWSLGAPLTARDASARDIAPALTLDNPRAPEKWPDVVPLPVPKFDVALVPPNAPLAPLPKAIFFACLALGKALGVGAPDIAEDADIKGGEAVATIRDMFGHIFPELQHQPALTHA
jgi:hypothetical protein